MSQFHAFAPVAAPVTICVLCYGDYPQLASRILGSLLDRIPAHNYRLRLGLNAVSARTDKALRPLLPELNVEWVLRSEVNSYKLPMMRRLFYDRPLETAWVLWFDDDSYVCRQDWFAMLCCESQLHPEVDQWGKECFIRAGEAHRDFVRNAPWYRGIDLERDDRPGGYRIRFVLGGFWAIRTSWLQRLDWPDPRLVHFGDDYMLGEALRQNGGRLGNAFSGVAINRSPRRAPAGTPRCDALH